MHLRVTGDIAPVLRHLVKALQSFANQQGVGLFFLSIQKKIIVNYDPEEMATETITRICREISRFIFFLKI
jgi:hypothetical protein